MQQVKYHQESVYEYLYVRGFFRSGDYFGIVIRLTIIGSVILTFINNQLVGNVIVVEFYVFNRDSDYELI